MLSRLLIDDYELHAENRSDRWVSPNVEGLDAPTYRDSSYERAGEDGSVIANQHYGMRLITLPGRLAAANQAEARRELQAICAIRRDQYGNPQPKRIAVTTLDGLELEIDGYPSQPQFGAQGIDWCDYQLQFKCPQPQLLGAPLSTGLITRPISVGAPFPWTFDPTIEFGTSSGGVGQLDNIGTMTGWVTVILRGALTNPTIYHEQSGATMQLNYTSGTNDEIVIDMADHAIVLNDSSSLMYAKTEESDWFGLAVGANTYRFTTGSTADTGTMEVTGYASYIGI